jgi:hypothetical protein
VITLSEARARDIQLPLDDGVAQDIIDEQEAWLARRIGLLEGERTETFYVGVSATPGKLALARYTDSVEVTDGGTAVDAAHFRLVDNGSAIVRTYVSPRRWWMGPYVEATYEPNDGTEVRRVLFLLLGFAVDEHADSPYDSERIGDYAYSKGGASGRATEGSRAALADSLLPKRDPATSIVAASRRLRAYDPVINRPELAWDDWP